MIYSLYMYTNKINGKRYIGVTNNIGRRHKEHTKAKSGAAAFNQAMQKYGPEAFDFKVLAIFDRVTAAAYHEQACIIKFGTLSHERGYNIQPGAPGTRYSGPMAEQSKQKLSKARMGQLLSEETRKKLSVARLGNTNAKGSHHSEEWRAEKSVAMLGKKKSPQMRAKTSIRLMGNRYALGHHHTEETKKQISISHLGLHPSDESRKKMSMSAKNRRSTKSGLQWKHLSPSASAGTLGGARLRANAR